MPVVLFSHDRFRIVIQAFEQQLHFAKGNEIIMLEPAPDVDRLGIDQYTVSTRKIIDCESPTLAFAFFIDQ